MLIHGKGSFRSKNSMVWTWYLLLLWRWSVDVVYEWHGMTLVLTILLKMKFWCCLKQDGLTLVSTVTLRWSVGAVYEWHDLGLIPTVTLKTKCGCHLWMAWSASGTYCYPDDQVCMSFQVYVALRSLCAC